jgi:hypothetical protein
VLEAQRSKIEIQGDGLILRLDDRQNIAMRRVSLGNAEGLAIIGRWSVIAADGTDNLDITEYKANGEWTGRIPIRVRKGRYEIKGDLLTVTFDDAEVRVSRFQFESGTLVLISPPESGPEDRFKRIE